MSAKLIRCISFFLIAASKVPPGGYRPSCAPRTLASLLRPSPLQPGIRCYNLKRCATPGVLDGIPGPYVLTHKGCKPDANLKRALPGLERAKCPTV